MKAQVANNLGLNGSDKKHRKNSSKMSNSLKYKKKSIGGQGSENMSGGFGPKNNAKNLYYANMA